MFNPEKMLGGLLSGAAKSEFGGISKGAIGLGVLGVAWAAAEHFMEQRKSSAPPGAAPPPPPGAGPAAVPPPPPGAAAVQPPPPPVAAADQPAPESAGEGAILLIRAMIAAAACDGEIDAEEKGRIMARLESVGLSPEEKEFIDRELESPAVKDDLAQQAKAAGLAREIYAASLLAVTVDTESERDYLSGLALLLGLDQETVDELTRELSARDD